MRKCRCGLNVHKDEAVQIGRRYYHPDCADKEKKKASSSDIEKQELKELKDFIYFDLYNKQVNMARIMTQISDFKNNYGYRYKGMELSLRYFYQTLDNRMKDGHGIGIIPFVYEDAKAHVLTIMNVKKSMQDYEEPVEKRVNVNVEKNTKGYSKLNEVDMDSL